MMHNKQQPASTIAPSRAAGVPTAISADLLEGNLGGARLIMLTLVGLVMTFVVWSAFARLEEITKGQGRVIPASKIQVVQSLEGGILREVLVREGAMVKKGEVLLRIDPTLANSSAGEVKEKILGLRARIARLEAETSGRALTFPPELVKSRPDIIAHQRHLFETRRRGLQATIDTFTSQEEQRAQELIEAKSKIEVLKRSLKIAQSELKIIKPLVRVRAASKSELLAAEGKVNDIDGELRATTLSLPRLESAKQEAAQRKSEKLEAYRSESLQMLATAQVELASLEQTLLGSEDRQQRTTIVSPARGIVKTVSVTTPGQVVQPGADLIEIVPLNDSLLIEAQIRPQDIAFLRPGQDATVKITAYDFSIYRGLEGKLVQIGADSITTEKGDSHYLIRIRTNKDYLEYAGKKLPIIPGMVAEVSVKTGAKTVLAYLTKPITRMRTNALTER